ncbi:ribosome biogenesis protein bop1-B-like [Glandiceps talaboti]
MAMETRKLKRKARLDNTDLTESTDNQLDKLFVDEPPESASDSDDESDSDESYYSGLEEDLEDSSGDEIEEIDEGEDEDSEQSDLEKDSEKQSDDDDDTEDKVADSEINTMLKRTLDSNKTQNNNGTDNLNELEADTTEVKDEYEEDSSDEEDIRNTVGNIPMQWYDDYLHIGYDLDGKKIIKPVKGDQLDEFLNRMENPEYWNTVKDKMTGKDVVLTDEEIDLIERIEKGRMPSETNMYEPYVDFFTNETMIHPVTRRPADKRSFIPSLLEKEKVGRLVHAMRMGWLKPSKKKQDKPDYYMLWDNDDQVKLSKRLNMHMPAPKLKLPGHEESYNPPPEYLPTEEEIITWEAEEPEDRRTNFLPKKYDCLRKVPAYSRYVRERFERCLDLYLCPRQQKMRVHVNPEDLIPKLPKPKDLQPFPTTQALVYKGHTKLIRTISVDLSGQWLASGSDDGTVRLWEVTSARCVKTIKVNGPVQCVSWCPNTTLTLIAIVVENKVHIVNTGLGDKLLVSGTDNVIENYEPIEETEQKKKLVDWLTAESDMYDTGFRLTIQHPKSVKEVSWHGRGDYFATVQPQGNSTQVLIHQLTKRRTQNPFRKPKGLVQCVRFHPIRPFLFVATQKFVRVYNLLKQELTKKLLTNVKWVSSMAIHPSGDNLIIGSYDAKLPWFDLDLSTKPYQTLRHHRKAIRQVCYHRSYPLFASASDDGSVIVCHGMVFSDLMQNPLIVPVKVMKGHVITNDLGVLDCQFHPTQPWLFSSGADNTIRLFT